MLFTKPFKEAIARGEITTSFRAWKRPMVKAGGEYNIPPCGAIRVVSVAPTTVAKATTHSVRAAGFESKEALLAFLDVAPDAPVYLVDFAYLGGAPVNVPDRTQLDGVDLPTLLARLRKIPWAMQALTLIRDQPRTRAGDLAPLCAMELPVFKRNVRRLKGMGLTVSHDVGYELSPRGRQALYALEVEA